MPAPFRQQRVLRRASGRPRARKVADRAGARRGSDHAPVSERHSDPGDNIRHRQWFGLAHRFHVPAQRLLRARAHRERAKGRTPDAHRDDRAVRLRRHRALGQPAGRRAASIHRRPRQGAARHQCRDAWRGFSHGRGFHPPRGRGGELRPQLVGFVSHSSRSALGRGARGRAQTGPFVLDRLGGRFQAVGPLGRGRPSLASHLESARALGDGRHRRRRYDVVAGEARRTAQLGLSLLLASGRDLHPLRADRGRHPGRSEGLVRLAPSRGRRIARRFANPLWRRGRAAASGI